MEHMEPYISTRLSEHQMRFWKVLHPVGQIKVTFHNQYRSRSSQSDCGHSPDDVEAGSFADRGPHCRVLISDHRKLAGRHQIS